MITQGFKQEVDGAINAATLWLVKEVLKKANITPDSLATTWQKYLKESRKNIVYWQNENFYDNLLTFARNVNESLYGELITDRLGISFAMSGDSPSKNLQDICSESNFDIKYLPNLFLMTVDFKIAGVIIVIAGEQKQIYGSTEFSADGVMSAFGLGHN